MSDIVFRNYKTGKNHWAFQSMTHSDVFKEQGPEFSNSKMYFLMWLHVITVHVRLGINAVGNCTWINSDMSQRIGHENHNTGSSRHFNIQVTQIKALFLTLTPTLSLTRTLTITLTKTLTSTISGRVRQNNPLNRSLGCGWLVHVLFWCWYPHTGRCFGRRR